MRSSTHETSSSALFGYGLAIAVTAVAVGLRWLSDPLFGNSYTLITLHAAVAITAWYGGYRAGILSALLGYLLCNYLFVNIPAAFSMTPRLAIGLSAYLLSCGIIIGLAETTQRARRNARERNETLQSTLFGVVDAVISTDHQGRITRLNSTAAALTGWPQDKAAGQNIGVAFNLVNSETREPVCIAVMEALRTKTVLEIAPDALLLGANNNEYFISGRAVPICSHGGRVTGCVLAFRDVTEQRRKEERLRRSEHEFSDLFEHAAIGIHWVDANGKILRANQAELDLLGYTHTEYVGHNIADFHADRAAIQEMLYHLRRGEEFRHHPARLRRKDGSIEHVLVSSNALFERGEFIHSRCFTFSISARKQVEETRALLAAIVSASDDAIISKSLDGVIRSWNTGAERLLGYTESEMIGRPLATIIPPELQDEEKSIISRIRRGERVDHFETVRLTKGGERINLSLTVSPVFDDSGRVIGASKVARDITERKHAEQALRASEERFRLMADSAPVLIWIAGTDKGCTWFNKQWLEFTGRQMQEEIGHGWTNNVHPDDIEGVLSTYQASFDARQAFTIELRLKHNDGQYRWVLDNGLPLHGAANEFMGYIGSCIDITDRKDAEEALEDEDRRKNEFIATLAHELRNPLAPILNSLEILKHTEPEASLLHQSRDTIERQLAHMVRLVDDLLDVSRITRDKLMLHKDRIDLASVIRQAVETIHPMVEDLGHDLDVNQPESPIYLEADPVRLAQVLSNLLNNACKFTNSGGRIRLGVEIQNGEACIAIKDNGFGIAADQIQHIFNMFSQSDTTTKRTIGGLGIGLTLAKRLVEMHGGRLAVHSEGPGCGSEFVVTLPVIEQRTAEQSSPSAQDCNNIISAQRILVVDDNLDSAETLALLLELNGNEVRRAHDGLAAVDAAERFRPDLILLDIGMPKLDGFEACRQIRKQPWGRELMIVALTGWGQEEDRRKTQEAGFNGHLVKPVSYAALTALMEPLAEPG